MARIRPYRRSARYYTPPPDLAHQQEQGHIQTPQRCGVIYAKIFSQELGIPINQELVRKVTGVAERIQSRILASKEVRTLHNQVDKGPDPRGRKRALTKTDTAIIGDYLSDSTTSLDDKGKPWLDIAEAAGVMLPETYHFKPAGHRMVETQSVQRACKEDENLINAVAEEEKLLLGYQAENRLEFIDEQLLARPHSKDWKDVVFCDEFHFGIGPQVTKRIKRRRGSTWRYRPENVHRKKLTSKDTKAKAREEEPLKLLNVFVVVGFNYRKIISYNVDNPVGKMTTKVYTEVILPQLLPDMQRLGLTLCQDHNSGHKSHGSLAWAKKHDLDVITLPGVLPDFSILESMAHPLKKKFHSKRCTTQEASLRRFTQIFEKEMDQPMIQRMYNSYTKRLHDCRRVNGQMTKY